MNLFVLNIVIAFIWLLLSEKLEVSTFVVGFVMGFFMIAALKPVFKKTIYIKKRFYKNSGYIRQTFSFCYFSLWFSYEFIVANLKVAWTVMTKPNSKIIPHIFTMDVAKLTTFEIVVLSQCITLTPGTTSIEISQDQNTLFVHALNGEKIENEKNSIENGLLKQILKFTR